MKLSKSTDVKFVQNQQTYNHQQIIKYAENGQISRLGNIIKEISLNMPCQVVEGKEKRIFASFLHYLLYYLTRCIGVDWENKMVDLFSFLLDKGSDPNCEDENKKTPFYIICLKAELSPWLLAPFEVYHSNVNLPNKNGLTPFHAASLNVTFTKEVARFFIPIGNLYQKSYNHSKRKRISEKTPFDYLLEQKQESLAKKLVHILDHITIGYARVNVEQSYRLVNIFPIILSYIAGAPPQDVGIDSHKVTPKT